MSTVDLQKIADGFDGASLKIERAFDHINELKCIVNDIGTTAYERLSITQDADSRYIVKFTALGPKARFIPLVIGDAIHNLRAAYDHIWTSFERALGKTGQLTFPFHETRSNLIDLINKSQIQEAFPEIKELLLSHVKPHSDAGGNHLLWTITKYDKIDKHNLILPTVNVTHIENVIIRSGMSTFSFENVNLSQVSGLLLSSQPFQLECNGKITIDVTFPLDRFLPGEPVIPSLISMADATSETLNLFKKTFL